MTELTVLETWLPVPGYEGLYEVSDLGRVRSLDRLDHRGHQRRGQIIKGCFGGKGYLYLNLRQSGVKQTYAVHSLVMRAFEGERPVGLEIRHLNGIPDDNRLSNLAYGTRSQNNLDSVRHGTHYWARKTHCMRGHEYSESNTRIYQGHRYCRQCQGERNRSRR